VSAERQQAVEAVCGHGMLIRETPVGPLHRGGALCTSREPVRYVVLRSELVRAVQERYEQAVRYGELSNTASLLASRAEAAEATAERYRQERDEALAWARDTENPLWESGWQAGFKRGKTKAREALHLQPDNEGRA
jgi:hypothetical protein